MNRFFPALAALLMSTVPAKAERVSVLVVDASGSMWNRVEGDLTRIEVARDVMADYFGSRDGAVPLSVIAYGHNRRGDCRDIEVIAPMGQTAPGTLETRLRGLMPRGMTPLTDSLALARDQIPPTAEAADIILVTDGLETCEGDPCALAASLAAEGIDIRAHVVGFGLSAAEVAALSCITDQTGGMLFQTNSGAELAAALQQVSAAAPPLPPEPVAEPDTPALFAQNFVFRDVGTGTPRGRMDWRAEAPDGTVIDLGTTDGIQQSLQGVSVEMPLGNWLIVAEGAEGRAERQMTLTQCCGRHGIPFTGTDMAAVIPPLGQVQAGMGARIPYEITHPGVGNLGGTPYQVIATGPEGALTPDQILRQDPLTRRDSGIQGARTGELAPGTYRFLIVVARNGGYDIRAERTFEAVENPVIGIVGPDRATPGERIEVGFDGGYTTRDWIEVVDENDRRIGQGNALYRGPGGGSGGPVTMTIVLPNREGIFDMVVSREGEILARRPITISATSTPMQGQDTLPTVPATFRLPPDVPQSDVTWSAQPLDPDMTSGPWTPTDTGPAITGNFEPGNWRITATAPGEVTMSADVTIFPGEVNDFTVQIKNDTQDGTLTGDWTLWAIPPAGIPDQPMAMAQISLRLSPEGQDYSGRFETTPAMGGPVSGDLISVIEEGALLTITFALPAISPDPLRLELAPAPDGAAFVGTLFVGDRSQPMALAPLGAAPDKAGWQDAAAPLVTKGSIVAQCDQPDGCPLSFGRLSLKLPHNWGMTEPLFVAATADAGTVDLPRAEFFGQGDGYEIRLNPHQWLDSNGPCIDTQAGRLCMFQDAPPETVLTALSMTMSLALAPAQEPVVSAAPDQPNQMDIPVAGGTQPSAAVPSSALADPAATESVAQTGPDVTNPVTVPGQDTITGRITLRVDSGAPVEMVTHSRQIPAVTPPAGADQAVIDFMNAMSGQVIHSANWTVVTGPIIVTLEAVETLELRTEGAGVKLNFNLDPATLDLLPGSTNIEITPNVLEFRTTFDLSEPQIDIASLRTGNENAMAVAGDFSGTGPDGLTYSGTFNIDAVTGSSLMLDVLTGR